MDVAMIPPLFLAALGPILAGLGKAILPSVISGVAGYAVSELTGTGTSTSKALVPVTGGGMTSTEASRRLVARTNVYPTYQQGVDYGFRRRRMNVLNPRALSRSIRRVKGFTKFAQRVGSYTQPGKRYRLKGFARRSRR